MTGIAQVLTVKRVFTLKPNNWKIYIMPFVFISLFCHGQSPINLATREPLRSKVNDSSYLRIFNGIIVKNDYLIKKVDRYRILVDKSDISLIGILLKKPILIAEVETNNMQNKIDSVLYNRPEFIKSYKFPLEYQLPISINGTLLSHEKEERVLSRLELNQIETIEYITNEQAMLKYGVTPFGVINLRLK